MTTPRQQQTAIQAMCVGLLLTVAATIAPYVDRATGNVLADHIRDGYPTYTQSRIDSAVTTWLLILTILGVLGVIGWLWTIWAVKVGKTWAPWAAGTLFVMGTSIALAVLLVKDTSGDVGLAPALGWLGLAPCLAGLAAVAQLWRRPW